MANFSEEFSTENGGNTMAGENAVTGLGGFGIGAVIGGLVGYGLNGFGRNGGMYGGYPYPVYPSAPSGSTSSFTAGMALAENGLYTQADVTNLLATKDAQSTSSREIQSTEFNILNTISNNNTTMAKDICSLAHDNAVMHNQSLMKVTEAQAQASLNNAITNNAISLIAPQMKQFYLEDEVAKLRSINEQQRTQCGFDKVNTNLEGIGLGIQQILNKLYSTTAAAASA